MTNEPPVPPFQAIANILAKKTALGKDMRYKQLDLTAKAKDAAETGLAILMEIVTSNKLQPTLSDDVYTALAWKMAAYAAMTKPINDINFRDNMARAGAYLALNPDLITSRAGLSAILDRSLTEQRRARRKAKRNPTFLDHVRQWRSISTSICFPECWRSSTHDYHAEHLTYDALTTSGMPALHSRNTPLAYVRSIDNMRCGRLNIYCLRSGKTPIAYFMTDGADLIQLQHHQPNNEAAWQMLAMSFSDLTGGHGHIRLPEKERARLAAYVPSPHAKGLYCPDRKEKYSRR